MISVALVLLVRASTGSYLPAGLTAAGYGLGSACAGPIAGRAVDQREQRVVLSVLALVFAAALGSLALSAGHVPVEVTIALSALTGVSRPPLESAMRALWPTLLAPSSLSLGYTIDAVGQDLVWLAGPLLLSILLLVDGPRAALLACAAASVLGTIVYTVRSQSRAASHPTKAKSRPRLLTTPLLALLTAALLYGISMGAYEIALTAFCTRHRDRAAVGILLAIWSLGSIAGALISAARPSRTEPHRRALALLLALGLLLACLQLASNIPLLGILIFIMGLPTAPFTAALSAGVQKLASAERSVEGFTWSTSMIATGIAIGNATAGPLAETQPHPGFLYAGTAAATGAALGRALTSHRYRPSEDAT